MACTFKVVNGPAKHYERDAVLVMESVELVDYVLDVLKALPVGAIATDDNADKLLQFAKWVDASRKILNGEV